MRRDASATSVASKQDKHRGRLDDTNMRVSSEPDNMEVQPVCKTEQTEPGSPGKSAATTSPTVGVDRDLGQDPTAGEQEKDNQSRNLGPNTQHQQSMRAHRSLVAPAIGNNPERDQSTQIGVVRAQTDQSRKVGVQARQDRNQNQEQEDRKCDARAAPDQKDAEQELQTETRGNQSQDGDGDSSPGDRAHAQARARQTTQVPLNKTSGTSEGEETETQTEAFPLQMEDRQEDGNTTGRSVTQKSSKQEPGEDMATRPVSKPTLSAAAVQHRRTKADTDQAEVDQGEYRTHAERVAVVGTGREQNKPLERPRVTSRDRLGSLHSKMPTATVVGAEETEVNSDGGEEKMKMSPLEGATQAAAARSSPGWEDSSVLEGSLKTHQTATGEGKSVYPNLNVSTPSQQSVDLQTVDRLHVSGGVAGGGGGALNTHSKGPNSKGPNSKGPNSKGLNSTVNTADSTVDHNERQLLQLQQQHSTAQSHPLTQGDPAQISGGGDGDAVGVLQRNNTVQNGTDSTDQERRTVNVEGRLFWRLSDQNLLPVSGQPVPALNSTAENGTVQYSKVSEGVTDSTPGPKDSDRDSDRRVSGGGGGRTDTDGTVPLTSVPVESEPTCKALLVPADGTGTNARAADPAASSQGPRNALGQGVVEESAAESSGGQWVTKPRPPACYVEQEVTTQRGASQQLLTLCRDLVRRLLDLMRRSRQHTVVDVDLGWKVQCVVTPHWRPLPGKSSLQQHRC